MPVHTNEQQVQDHTVVQFWEEAIKDWYSTLIKTQISCKAKCKYMILAFKRSSKSHVVSFFSSETLFENHLIVSPPNVGTCLKLHATKAHKHSPSSSAKKKKDVLVIKFMN